MSTEDRSPQGRGPQKPTLDAAALDFLHDNMAHDYLGDHPDLIAQARLALAQAERIATLEAEVAEEAELRTRMGDLLTLTANALRGEPDSRSLHDWATLPEVARGLVADLAEAREHAKAWESEADSANALGQSWMARAAALRDALVKCAPGGVEREDDCRAMKRWRDWWREYGAPALASTPAASLAAHDAEVLERAAKACDERKAFYDGLAEQAMAEAEVDAEAEGVAVSTLDADFYDEKAGVCHQLAVAIRALAAQEVKP